MIQTPIRVLHVLVRSTSYQARPSLQDITIYWAVTLHDGYFNTDQHVYYALTDSGFVVTAEPQNLNVTDFHSLQWEILLGEVIPDDIHNDYWPAPESIK